MPCRNMYHDLHGHEAAPQRWLKAATSGAFHLFISALILVDGVDFKARVRRPQLRLKQVNLSEHKHNDHEERRLSVRVGAEYQVCKRRCMQEARVSNTTA